MAGERHKFDGDYAGISWNCNSLFSSDIEISRRGNRTIADWLHSKADFVTIQEAHSTNNRAAYLRNQLYNCDVEFFWTAPTDSREAKSKAGVLLIVRKSFLGQFEFQEELRNVRTNCSHSAGLANSAQGHAIGLRLQNRLTGDLDIWAIYAPPDNAQRRRRLWITIASNVNKSALNAMAGDFNFVECNGDRFNGLLTNSLVKVTGPRLWIFPGLSPLQWAWLKLSSACIPVSGYTRQWGFTPRHASTECTPAYQWAGLSYRNPSVT